MTELIQITTTEQGSKVVSARELHLFLEVKTRFNDWIKNRIIKYGFLEGTDYVEVTKILESDDQGGFTENLVKPSTGGRPEIDYALTLDMAKELSMVERNPKGKEARQYFIEAERNLKKLQTASPSVEQTLLQQAYALIETQQKQNEQQQQINQLRAEVEYIKAIGHRPPIALTPDPVPVVVNRKPAGMVRQQIIRLINDYCGYYQVSQQDAWRWIYKLLTQNGINVYRLTHNAGESHLDVLQRLGHLDRLYSLVATNLSVPEDF